MTMEEAAEAAVAAATEESSAAEGRRPAGADVAALGPDPIGPESAARGAPLGRTGCWAQPGQLAGASEVAASVASAVVSVAFGVSAVVAEVAEQEPLHLVGAHLGCAKVFHGNIFPNRCIEMQILTTFDKVTLPVRVRRDPSCHGAWWKRGCLRSTSTSEK